MSFFSDYQRQANSITQSDLESDEGIMYDRVRGIRDDALGRASLLQGQYGADMSKTQDEFMEQLGIEQGIPGALKLLQAGARNLGTAVKGGSQLLDKATEGASKLAQRIAPQPKTSSEELSGPMDDVPQVPQERRTFGGYDDLDTPDDDPDFSPVDTTKTPSEVIANREEAQAEDIGDTTADTTAGDVAEDVAEDAGEIGTSLGELAETAGSSIAEALGSAIPVVGWIGDLASVISGAVTASKVSKEENPAVAESQMIQSANTKTQALQARVSGDQFEQRIGANMPSFGSLALAGQRAQQNIALHD